MGGGGDVEGSRRARARCLLQRHPVLSAGNELLRGLRANAMDYSSLNEIFLVNYSLEPKLSNEKDVLEELITVSVEIQAHLSCVGLMAECCPPVEVAAEEGCWAKPDREDQTWLRGSTRENKERTTQEISVHSARVTQSDLRHLTAVSQKHSV